MVPRILIAEDDEMQSAIMQAAVQERGYEVDIVSDGLEAVRRLRTGVYDVALLDYHLPDVDGLAAARLLHDVPGEGKRAQLIAVTATADRLNERQIAGGTASFDAVVSKRQGLPALLDVIDDHLNIAARAHDAEEAAAARETAYRKAARRRRRLLAPLAALPAFAMASAFAAALGWASASLHNIGAAAGSAHQTMSLSANASALTDAVHAAQLSGQTYLATGQEAHRDQFYAASEQVDRLLSARSSLRLDGQAGFEVGAAPQKTVEPAMAALGMAVQKRGAVAGVAAVTVPSDVDEVRVSQTLSAWAGGLVARSEQLVLSSLDAARRSIQLIFAVLIGGLIYGLWNAGKTIYRRWQDADDAPVTLQAATAHPIVMATAIPAGGHKQLQ
jgi:CheY-like chemotaxis protein